MSGKILKISSNDLYGNADDRIVYVYACFEHTKYMNNYVVFSIEGDNKLYYGSVHFKANSLVVFSVKDDVKMDILEFLDEYMSDNIINFRVLEIDNVNKVELVSYSMMEYNNIKLLEDKSIPKIVIKEDVVVKDSKNVLGYILIFLLILFGIGITFLYFKPELFTIKYKELRCSDNLYDENMGLYYDIDKIIRFNRNDKVDSISVVRMYMFLDSKNYYEFRDNDMGINYFNNGEGYKYIDDELKFKVFYQEESVIDDYDEMLFYMKREGFSCIESEYEE